MTNQKGSVVVMDTATEKGRAEMEKAIAPYEGWLKTPILIKSEVEYLEVDARVKLVKKLIKDADETFDPTIKKYYEPYKFWQGIKKGITEKLEAIEKVGKRAMIVWYDEQEAARKKEEARLQKEADENARKAAAALTKKADKEEAKGNSDTAAALRENAATVVPTPIAASVVLPEVKGTSIKDNWVGQVVDLPALVRAAAANPNLMSLIMADQSAINKFAKATKDTFKVDGIRFWNDKVISASTRG